MEAGETQGNHVVTILAHSSDDFEKIRNEVARGVAQINMTLGERELQLMGQPDNFRTQLIVNSPTRMKIWMRHIGNMAL